MTHIKYYTLVFVALLMTHASMAETITFKNGDKISGKITAKNKEWLSMKTAYGFIKVPLVDIAAIQTETQVAKAKEEAKKAEKQAEEKQAALVASASVNAPAELEKKPEAPKTWANNYADFIHRNIPEGWEFKVFGGLEYRDTSSETLSYSLGASAHKKWYDVNEFTFNLFYDYASETPSNGSSYRTTDKYGAVANYKRYFEKENSWFLTSTTDYSVDTIRGIKDQADEIFGIGRTFKLLDEKLVINASAGPSLRYINAVDYDQHWIAMATAQEDLIWKFHDYAHLEQSLQIGMGLTNIEYFSAVFNIGVVFKLSEILNIVGRYYYSYDGINASTAQKSEQRLTLGFEIPFK